MTGLLISGCPCVSVDRAHPHLPRLQLAYVVPLRRLLDGERPLANEEASALAEQLEAPAKGHVLADTGPALSAAVRWMVTECPYDGLGWLIERMGRRPQKTVDANLTMLREHAGFRPLRALEVLDPSHED